MVMYAVYINNIVCVACAVISNDSSNLIFVTSNEMYIEWDSVYTF